MAVGSRCRQGLSVFSASEETGYTEPNPPPTGHEQTTERRRESTTEGERERAREREAVAVHRGLRSDIPVLKAIVQPKN